MLKRLNELKAKSGEQGFTLIELLIVVAIIGILAAIAIPQFAQYRLRAFNASAMSDVRNTRTAEEAVFATFQDYGRTDPGAPVVLPGAGAFGAGAVIEGPMGPATTLVAGGLLTTMAGVPLAPVGVGIGVGNLVSLVANTDAAGASYTAAANHQNGNTAYGADSDSTALFWVSDPAWAGQVCASGAGDLCIGARGYAGTPAAIAGTDEFTLVAGGGVPIATWTAQ